MFCEFLQYARQLKQRLLLSNESIVEVQNMFLAAGAAVVVAATCIYEISFSWNVDFRGGNVILHWRLKKVSLVDDTFTAPPAAPHVVPQVVLR